PRDGRRRNGPRRRLCPVAAIDQTGCCVRQARRLRLWESHRRPDGGDEPGSPATVIAHAIDVEPIGARGRVDLETNGLPLVDADVGRESLDAGVARAGDVPPARQIAGQSVFAGDWFGALSGWIRPDAERRAERSQE